MASDQQISLEEDGELRPRKRASSAEIAAVLRIPATQRGILAILAGSLLLLWPSRTFIVTVGIAGMIILFGGLSDIWGSRAGRDWSSFVKGVATTLLGVLLVTFRQESEEFLGNLIGVVALVASMLDVIRAIRARRNKEPWLWFLTRALIEGVVAVGTVLLGPYTIELILMGGAMLWLATGIITVWHSVLYRENSEFSDTISAPQIAYEWLQMRDLGDEDRAIVVQNLIFEGESFKLRATRFAALMAFATAIAAFGVQTDSTAVVIGAMLVAPLMTPIMATSVSLVMGWQNRAIRSLSLVAVGVALSIAIGFIIGHFMPSFIAIASNSQITSRASPTMFDLLIALAAGGAGGYAVCRQDVSDSLPGVAISVALVPPLAVVGITLAASDFDRAGGAMLLFLTNFVGIILTSGIVFIFVGFSPWSRMKQNRHNIRKSFALVAGALALIAIPLGTTGQTLVSTSANQQSARDAAEDWANRSDDLRVVQVNRSGSTVEIIMTGIGIPGNLDDLAAAMTDIYGQPMDVELDVIPRLSYTTKDEEP